MRHFIASGGILLQPGSMRAVRRWQREAFYCKRGHFIAAGQHAGCEEMVA